ncbi:MAG: hypothetical protein M1834_000281 [Cirrosporium novae-zelandiae]|nr:MAG: hypothetical protein M1834_000281 [Cirrosporium novae-zelandiae]
MDLSNFALLLLADFILTLQSSGNFDYPPASSSHPTAESSDNQGLPDIPARIRNLRDLLESERGGTRGSMENSPFSQALLNRRRRRGGDPARSNPNSSPYADYGSRPIATPTSRRRQRFSPYDGRRDSLMRDFEEAEARLAQQNDQLDVLLTDPMPYIDAVSSDHPRDRTRAKRRKLDHIPETPGFQGFKYGYYGQVVPGKLKMEIKDCDGGDYPSGGENRYGKENVLKDDTTVYCTESNRCNMILQHQDETTFCITKITIKAPRDDFSAPVQEGMVFVSMTSDELLDRTARYEIHYSSPRKSRKCSRHNQNHSTLRPSRPRQGPPYNSGNMYEYVSDEDEDDNNEGEGEGEGENGRDENRDSESGSESDHDPLYDLTTLQYPQSPHHRMIDPYDPYELYGHTSDSDGDAREDDDDDKSTSSDSDPEGDPPSQHPIHRVRRSRRLPTATVHRNLPPDPTPQVQVTVTASSSRDPDSNCDSSDEEEQEQYPRSFHRPRLLPISRRSTPSRIELSAPPMRGSGSGPSDPANNSKTELEVMSPNARFFIEKDKSMINIKFDPPL